ncbi:MAG: hypothetical protein MRY64_11295 [Hyphomonadaceae bacterium]|nr:hypothetical protein [Hyphomonadaceae bacterium]
MDTRHVLTPLGALTLWLLAACTAEPQSSPAPQSHEQAPPIDLTDKDEDTTRDISLPVLRDPTLRTDEQIRFMFYQSAVVPALTTLDTRQDWHVAEAPVATLECSQTRYEISFPVTRQDELEGTLCRSDSSPVRRILKLGDRNIQTYRIGSGSSEIAADICISDLLEDAKLLQTVSYFCGAGFLRVRVQVLRETDFNGQIIAQSSDQFVLEVGDEDLRATLKLHSDDARVIQANRSTLQTGSTCGDRVYPCSDAERAAGLAEHRDQVAARLEAAQ